jgi:hypothetical protein
MIIEETVRNYLNEQLECPVWLEIPKGITPPAQYVLLMKTGSGRYNHLNSAVIAAQSYADSLIDAMDLNEAVKNAMDSLITLDSISRSALNSDYNFTDTQTKKYRYQAVYDITHY